MKIKTKIKLLEQIQKKKCKYCLSTDNLTLDHKIPLIRGGKNEVKNIQVLCNRCNSIKGNITHNEIMNLFKMFYAINKSRAEIGRLGLGEKRFNKHLK